MLTNTFCILTFNYPNQKQSSFSNDCVTLFANYYIYFLIKTLLNRKLFPIKIINRKKIDGLLLSGEIHSLICCRVNKIRHNPKITGIAKTF